MNATDPLLRAQALAEHYGFRSLAATPRPTDIPVQAKPEGLPEYRPHRTHEKVFSQFAQSAAKHGLAFKRTPSFVHRIGTIERKSATQRVHSFELHAISVPTAFAEALVIHAGLAWAREMGALAPLVRINSLGGADARLRYSREAAHYLRRHAESIPQALRADAVSDPVGTLIKLIDKRHALADKIPNSMEYLNEDERRHVWELLEYLELNSIPYEFTPTVLGHLGTWNHVLFDITEGENTYARGGRYDTLLQRFASTTAAAVGTHLLWNGSGINPALAVLETHPSIYFAHLSTAAKQRALKVMEILRRTGTPVHQSLGYDRLGEQMNEAQILNYPYILIMGHKEAMEDEVIFRDTRTNAQHAIPLNDLSTYLKRKKLTSV
jgi:histidyl-tRNA synthetase